MLKLTLLENKIVVLQLKTLLYWVKEWNKVRGEIDFRPITKLIEKFYKDRKSIRDEKGQVIIVVALSLLVIIPLMLGVLDMGLISIGRNEAQNGADSACLAGGRVIGSQYEALKCEDRINFVCSTGEVISVVNDLLLKNRCELDTVKIGIWNWGSRTIDETDENTDAVQVVGIRKVNLSIIPLNQVKAHATGALIRDTGGLIGPCGADGNWFVPKIVE